MEKEKVKCDVDHAVREFVAATSMLGPHNLDVKQAAQMISDALTRLGKVPLSTALDFYDRHGKTMKAVKTVPEVVTELVENLRKDGCSAYHVRDMETRLGRFADLLEAKVTLGRNTFRNCYISYRVAQPKPASEVAAETGTSARMIESNYKELATQDEAKRWFSINPTKAELVKLREYAKSIKTDKK